MGLEPTAMRSRVACSIEGASQAPLVCLFFMFTDATQVPPKSSPARIYIWSHPKYMKCPLSFSPATQSENQSGRLKMGLYPCLNVSFPGISGTCSIYSVNICILFAQFSSGYLGIRIIPT